MFKMKETAFFKAVRTFLRGTDNETIKKRQTALMFSVVGFGIFLVFMILFGGEDNTRKPHSQGEKPPQKVDIQTAGARVNPEEVWRFRQEDKTKDLKGEIQSLKETIEGLIQEKNTQDQEREEKMALLEEKLKNTKENFESKFEGNKLGDKKGGQSFYPTNGPSGGFNNERGFGNQSFGHPAGSQGTGIQKIAFPLNGGDIKEQIKTVDNTIPAGSFAKAILLAGVDASTAMTASADPRPMLLRIVDLGSLPRRFKSDLKDCRCTASTYGDISSERVYVRLEKLTCIERETGEVVETQVAGYVAGSDGRAGIRGKVVSKDAAYLGRGLISGVLGGFAAMASPKQTPNFTLGLGTSTVDTPSKRDLFTSSLGQGTSQALDRLSGYYIDRAEQLQPVVQVGAGQYVDVIFTEGVSIGDTNVKREISKVRDVARLKAAKRLSKNSLNHPL